MSGANALCDLNSLEDRFVRMRQSARGELNPSIAVRQARLETLERLLGENAAALAEAVSGDFGHRSRAETRLLEFFPCREAIACARRNLRRWMRPQRRRVSLWFQPASAEVQFQPLGAVGIIAPWNYPIYLAVAPLVAALAAGNRALVKMSEFTPATARLFAELIARNFADDEVSVVEGDAALARAFAQLPFDHLLFTGSTPVGCQVMRAAAKNLTPVTLELGGKCPAIIGTAANFEKAVERILVGKTLNAGQTCIAPDYVLVPAGREQAFIEAARGFAARCYPDIENTPVYSSIINERHYERLTGYVDEARRLGAQVVELAPGKVSDRRSRRLLPLILLGVNEGMRVMHDEIFGPLLPLLPYRDLDQAMAFVNARPRPLSLYYFDTDSSRIEKVLKQTLAGSVTVNDTLLHVAQDDLPFGGVGPSGMGRYHGFEGFKTFSLQKSVFRQARISGIGLFKPPYGAMFERLIKVLLR